MQYLYYISIFGGRNMCHTHAKFNYKYIIIVECYIWYIILYTHSSYLIILNNNCMCHTYATPKVILNNYYVWHIGI